MGRPRCCRDLSFVFSEAIPTSRQARRPAESQSGYASVGGGACVVWTTFNSRARGRGGKMRLRSTVLHFTSVFLLLSCSAYAQTPTSSAGGSAHDQQDAAISGTVFDPAGQAVPGARVTVLYAMAPRETRDTNAPGQYSFTGLRAGKYQILATISGFDQLPVDIDLATGEKRLSDLHLKLS